MKETYRTLSGQIIEYDRPNKETAAFLARVLDMANRPESTESELVNLIYGKENSLLDQSILPTRGMVTKEAYENPIFQVMMDLLDLKRIQYGTVGAPSAVDYTVTVPEAAEKAGVHQSAIRQAIQAGRISAIKVGGSYRISKQSLSAFEPSNRGPKPADPKWESAALYVCFGNTGSQALKLKLPEGHQVLELQDGPKGIHSGVIKGKIPFAVLTKEKMSCRFFEISYDPNEPVTEFKYGPFFIKGRFRKLTWENNSKKAALEFKEWIH